MLSLSLLLLPPLQGIGFIIQSDKFDAAHLSLQVELFVQRTLKRIASLPEVRVRVCVWEGGMFVRWWAFGLIESTSCCCLPKHPCLCLTNPATLLTLLPPLFLLLLLLLSSL